MIPLLLLAVFQDPSLFEERRLGVVPDGLHVDQVYFSPDGRSVSYSAREGQRGWMVVDGKKGEEFDWTLGLNYSPDRQLAAYWAASLGKYLVVTGERRDEEFDSGSAIVFCADGRTVMYSGMQDGRQFLVTGGKKEEFDADRPIRIVASPDGKSVAVEGKQGGKVRTFLDGSPKGGRNEETFDPCFSEDGSFFAFMMRAAGKSSWVVGGLRGDPFDEVGPLAFSPDLKTFAYVAADRTGSFVVVGVRKGKKYGRITTEHITFSPDGKTVAYGAMTGNKVRMVVGEKEGDEFDQVHYPKFSPDGKTVAYSARTGEGWQMILGEEKGPFFWAMGGENFSADGRTVEYLAQHQDRWVVVSGGKVMEGVVWGTPHYHFNPGGGLAFWAEKNGKEFVVVSGRKGADFDKVDWLFFSPRGTPLYRGWKGSVRRLVAGDRTFDDLEPWCWPVFSPDGTKAALGVRQGQELWWKVVDLK